MQTKATAVVQLLHALPDSRDRWTKQVTGVACLVKDNLKQSYFIRVYDPMVSSAYRHRQILQSIFFKVC